MAAGPVAYERYKRERLVRSGSLSAELSAPETTAAPPNADIKDIGIKAKFVDQAFGSFCIILPYGATRMVSLRPYAATNVD